MASNATVNTKADNVGRDLASHCSSPSHLAGRCCLQSTISGVTCATASDPVRRKAGPVSLAVATGSQARRAHILLAELHSRKSTGGRTSATPVFFGASRDSCGRGLSLLAGAYSPLSLTINSHFLSQLLFQPALVVLQF